MNRDMMYKNFLKGGPETRLPFSPEDFVTKNMSPVSSLANLTLYGVPMAHNTPRKRLSLSSNMTDTPSSFIEDISTGDLSLTNELLTRANGEANLSFKGSPRNNKENVLTPYYSPSHKKLCTKKRSRNSPLKDVQNTVNRNLSFSPLKKLVSPSKRQHLSPVKKGPSIEEWDSNSRDSGYSESDKKGGGGYSSSESDQKSENEFSVPRSCAPTRRLNLDMSPIKVIKGGSRRSLLSSTSSSDEDSTETSKQRSFASLHTITNDDEDFMDTFLNDFEADEEFTHRTLTSLVQASNSKNAPNRKISFRRQSPMKQPSPTPRPPSRRCLSMIDNNTPVSSRIVNVNEKSSFELNLKATSALTFSTESTLTSSLTTSSISVVSFKRPNPPSETYSQKRSSPVDTPSQLHLAKRRRSEFSSINPVTQEQKKIIASRQRSSPDAKILSSISPEEGRPRVLRSHSESHVTIMKALNDASNNNDLMTGDFSRKLALPIVQSGRHPDLRCISVETMAALIKGQYDETISSFEVVDCRYPYEFSGGHITQAASWHHPKMVSEYMEIKINDPPRKNPEGGKREILIFHCEFSAERGPKAQRMLREYDRTANKEYYPLLHFPELYLLEGGYKSFYELFPEMCSPQKYVKMVDEKHAEDMKLLRAKSKSWAADNKNKSRNLLMRTAGTGPKRLGI